MEMNKFNTIQFRLIQRADDASDEVIRRRVFMHLEFALTKNQSYM